MQVVLSKKPIAKRYLQGLFVFDLLINFPLLFSLISGYRDSEFHYLDTLNLLRLVRLGTAVRYSQRFLLRIAVDDKYLEIFKLTFIWIICTHWAACLLVLPGIVETGFSSNSMVGAWYEQELYQNRNIYGQYVICLFKTVKTFHGTGTVIELQPIAYFDKIYSAMLTIIGRFGLLITFAHIYGIVQGMKSSSLRYDEMMVQINKYTDQNRFPESTKAKLKNNYDFIFNKRYFVEKEILKTIPTSLRQQILAHNTQELVENSAFFEGLPSSLVSKIITVFNVELYLEGDIIFTSGQVGSSVYFISSGSVAFFTPNGNELCHFSDGDYFGVYVLISDVAHHNGEVVALETTECYT